MEDIRATVHDEHIVIRIPFEQLQLIANGGWAAGYIDPIRIDDPPAFATAMCNAINDEAEDGTTPLHQMIDNAITGAFESGEGELISDAEAEDIARRFKASTRGNPPMSEA